MKLLKCKFEIDKWGMYILPILGYSWYPQNKSIWIGWLYWMWVIRLEDSK